MAWSTQGNIKGPQGALGPTGPQGPAGADGTGVTILGSYPSEAALISAHPTGSPGDAYLVVGDLYVWSATDTAWNNVGSIKGPKGDLGDQGPQGIQGIQGPAGVKGDTGNTGAAGTAATVAIGSVTGLAAGASPTVNNSGSGTAATLNFGIPKGDTGATGLDGAHGTTWFFGDGAPGTVIGAVPGDAYLDTNATTGGTVYKLT